MASEPTDAREAARAPGASDDMLPLLEEGARPRPDVAWRPGRVAGGIGVLLLVGVLAALLSHQSGAGSGPARSRPSDGLSKAWQGEGYAWESPYEDEPDVSRSYDEGDDGDRRGDGYDGDGDDGDEESRTQDSEPALSEEEQEVVDVGLRAAKDSQEAGDAAADQAAKAGAATADEAKSTGWSEEDVARLASIAATSAGLDAGMPKAAADTAGMLAAQALTAEPTPPPKPIPPRVSCRTAVPDYEQDCVDNAAWIKNTGIHEHPEWYPDVTPASSLADFQTAAVASGHSECKLKGCPDDGIECLPDGHGCVSDAVDFVKSWLQSMPAAVGECKEPQVKVQGRCVCPPQYELSDGKCKLTNEAKRMSFYMYRAQSDYVYPMENVNLADLPGVMWYLQKEVVASVPRKYNVTRILRYLVTMKNPDATFQHVHWIYGENGYGKQFAPFGAFDDGKCTATNCMQKYEEYGNAVGCQAVEILEYNYKRQMPATNCEPEDSPECISGTWYSLPGACPQKTLYKKTDECKQEHPGAQCASPDGSSACTYKTRYAGQVELDELVGIPDYEKWWVDEDGPTGNIEYEKSSDSGNGTAWWDGRHDEAKCNSRMEQVIDLFGKRYPDLPKTLPDPPCL